MAYTILYTLRLYGLCQHEEQHKPDNIRQRSERRSRLVAEHTLKLYPLAKPCGGVQLHSLIPRYAVFER